MAPHPEQFLERRVAARRPDLLICNSAYTDRLAASWLPGVPREIVHPAVAAQPPLAAEARRQLRRSEGADEYATIILLAARLEAWKGHRVLLDAAARLRGSFAVWIAGGAQRPHEAAYLASLTAFAGAHLPPGRVRFLGDRNDVPRLMAAADIYCQPNTAPEPFGVVFVEALAAGVPVVTSAMGGAMEIVDDRCGALVDTVSAEAFAAALQRLIDDRERRAWLGSAGPERARRLSDPSARARELDEAIRAQRTRSSAA
jgi:glycosyltransferase involved in cell wall biosynthesis